MAIEEHAEDDKDLMTGLNMVSPAPKVSCASYDAPSFSGPNSSSVLITP